MFEESWIYVYTLSSSKVLIENEVNWFFIIRDVFDKIKSKVCVCVFMWKRKKKWYENRKERFLFEY